VSVLENLMYRYGRSKEQNERDPCYRSEYSGFKTAFQVTYCFDGSGSYVNWLRRQLGETKGSTEKKGRRVPANRGVAEKNLSGGRAGNGGQATTGNTTGIFTSILIA